MESNGMIQLILVILNWVEIVAISAAAISLTIVLFYTQHQGRWYRISFSAYIVLLLCWVFVLSVSNPPTMPTAAGLIRPFAMLVYSVVCWFRMRFFVQKAKNEASDKTAMTTTTVFDIATFTLTAEKLQKYMLFIVGGFFLTGLLVTRINRVELLQYSAIAANQQSKAVATQVNRRLQVVEQKLADTSVGTQILLNQAVLEQKVDRLSIPTNKTVSAAKKRVSLPFKQVPTLQVQPITVPPLSATLVPIPVPAEKEKRKHWYWPPDWFSANADSTQQLIVDFKPIDY